MIEIYNKNKCCGCGACSQICPKACIEMKPDKEGFLYPTIDKNKCINCSLCEKVCPYNATVESNHPITSYGFVSKDPVIHAKASSGGAFLTISNHVIAQGGVVFGAAFSDDYEAVNIIPAKTKKDLSLLVGSKYLQAKVGNSYKVAEQYLKNGTLVLFTSTPCQIAGLHAYLRKEYDNLITIDCICHSVPSPKVWSNYLKKISSGRKVNYVSFREKVSNGWHNYSLHIKDSEDKTILLEGSKENVYMRSFISNLITRSSCYNCCALNFKSCSDITIGDFWNVEKYHSDKDCFMRNDGVSLIMVGTKKGQNFLTSILDQDVCIEVPIEHVELNASHSCLVKSSKPHELRNLFFKLFPYVPTIELMQASLYTISKLKDIKHKIK